MVNLLASLYFLAVAVPGVLVSGYSDNCNGSFQCSKDMGVMCQDAFNRYTDNTIYNGYTSRTNGHCTAIFRCQRGYPSLSGAQIKSLFWPIYRGQGCKGCGSHAFDGGNCEVTLNYCSNCVDSGNPN